MAERGIPGSSSAQATPSSSSTTPSSSTTTTTKPEIPWAFIDCPSDTLVVLIAHMLELLCQHNDQVVLTPDALTRFHSRAPPGISIIEYLRRIVKYTNLEKIPLLSLLAYIDLTCQNLPTFTLSSLTVHRFLIAGVTAGSKAQCDVFCTNSHYAKVGGIKVTELNSLEREFLRVTGWALCCTSDLLQRYYTSLIRSHGGYTQAPEPAESPFLAFPHAGEQKMESIPPTPADSAGDEAMDSDDDEDEEDDEAEEGQADFEGEEGEMEGEIRGRAKEREMDVDDKSRPQDTPHASVPQNPHPISEDAQLQPQDHQPQDEHQQASEAGQTSQDSSRGLKSLVGGIFRRQGSADQSRTRSRPVASPAASPLLPGELPRQLTPRVRTRDERSVESLRVERSLPPAVVVEEGKRRARQ